MATMCPKCKEKPLKVEQKSGSRAGGGLVGFMIMRAFTGKYVCENCGPIEKSEFPPDLRRSIAMRKMGLVLGAIVLLVALVVVLVALN
jgi:hypothetical protein